jgi:hypothetical protein
MVSQRDAGGRRVVYNEDAGMGAARAAAAAAAQRRRSESKRDAPGRHSWLGPRSAPPGPACVTSALAAACGTACQASCEAAGGRRWRRCCCSRAVAAQLPAGGAKCAAISSARSTARGINDSGTMPMNWAVTAGVVRELMHFAVLSGLWRRVKSLSTRCLRSGLMIQLQTICSANLIAFWCGSGSCKEFFFFPSGSIPPSLQQIYC